MNQNMLLNLEKRIYLPECFIPKSPILFLLQIIKWSQFLN